MANGIARLGIHALFLITQGASAVAPGGLLVSEIVVIPAVDSNSRGEWYELSGPSGEVFDPRHFTGGDEEPDLHRIESDLLILPPHFPALAGNWRDTIAGGRVRTGIPRQRRLHRRSTAAGRRTGGKPA